MAVVVNNFNLGVFSLLAIFLMVLCYYLKPEDEFYVWSYSLTPAKFLLEKLKTAYLFTFYLYLPILLLLCITSLSSLRGSFLPYLRSNPPLNDLFFGNIGLLFLVILMGYLYLTAIILAKYSAYTNEMEIKEALLLFICLIVPPVLLVVIPYFANRAVVRLKAIL
jgi:hypothetical protein